MKIKLLFGLTLAALSAISTQVSAGSILIAEYWDYNITPIINSLESSGHTVDKVNGAQTDSIYNAMNSTSYDQVYIFDVTTTNHMSSKDLSALKNLHNRSKSMVIDTQSYNYTTWNTSDSDGIQFLKNIANQFDSFGGGIYLGSDHAPEWAENANAVLDAFGMDLITDSIFTEITAYDVNSPLFSGVNPFNWRMSSYGRAITGMQGGQMFTSLATGNNGTTDLISASFVGDAEPVPAPAPLALMGLGLAALGYSRKRKV